VLNSLTVDLDSQLRDQANELLAIERMAAGARAEMLYRTSVAARWACTAAGAKRDAAIAGRFDVDSAVAAVRTAAACAASGQPRIDDRVAAGTMNVKHCSRRRGMPTKWNQA
jgi:hypothetical protein